MKRVAITGGFSSGKSLFAEELAKLGAHVVSSDKIVHHLLHDSRVQAQVVQLLGSEVLRDHELDVQAIANRIFREPQLRVAMERLLHPMVYEEIERASQSCAPNSLFIAEVPLLFESEGNSRFDEVVCIDTPVELSRARYCAAGGSTEEFDRRERNQLARSEKARRASIIISNTGDREALRQAAHLLYRNLTQNLNEPRRDRTTG
ncbi:MAG: dephospho-CoA kinase [Chlamydiia bacterium]